jgi:anti-sigma factor RsiW
MYCKQYRDVIQELVDGTLGPVRRAELQTHLDQCDDCRALVADLKKIRETAASFEHPAPPDRVWMQIAGRLHQEGRVTPVAHAAKARPFVWLALAATLFLAVGASIYVLYPLRNQRVSQGTAELKTPAADAGSGNASAADTVKSIADDLQVAEQHYQSAIDKLQVVADLNDGTIDRETAAVLTKNLQVINGAISESRAALQTDPQSAPARESLFEALRQKVTLLQDTIALMNELRKGNSAGAAQIIDGANKS